MRAPASLDRRDGYACLAGMIAWLFLATSLAAFVHRAQVQHEVCAAHGEPIHVDGRGWVADDRSPGSPSSTDASTIPSLRERDTGHEHGRDHEHCELGQVRPGTCERIAGSHATGLPEPALALDERRPTGDPPPAIALDHRRAPKTSPPRLG